MRAWKFEPKPEAMTRIRHGDDDSSGPVILEKCGDEMNGTGYATSHYCFRV